MTHPNNKSKPRAGFLRWSLSLATCLTLTCHSALGVFVEVNPPVVTNDFNGKVTLQITGLTSGQTVRCERFVDLNRNGEIEPDDLLVDSFLLTDGEAPQIAGVRNVNAPYDEDDSSDGQITADVFYPRGFSAHRWLSASFLVRISDLQNTFTPATQPFLVTPRTESQGVQGRILRPNGTPWANTPVFLNTFGSPRSGTVTDTNGFYRLYTYPGNYSIGLVRNAINASTNRFTKVKLNQFTTLNLTATNASSLYSGSITVANETNSVPGLFLDFDGVYATFSDASGRFKSLYKTVYSQYVSETFERSGYFSSHANGPDTNTAVIVRKATAQLYGRFVDAEGNSLTNMPLAGDRWTGSESFYSDAYSIGPNGAYSLPLDAGKWRLYVGRNSEYWPPADLPSEMFLEDEAVEMNIVMKRTNAHLTVLVVDDANKPVTNAFIYFESSRGSYAVDVNPQGKIEFPTVGGVTWKISYIGNGNYFSSPALIALPDNVQTNVVYKLSRLSSKIVGSVKTDKGVAIQNAYITARTGSLDASNYRSAQTDKDGRFSLYVTNGTWSVSVGAGSGYAPTSPKTVQATGSNWVSFVMKPYPSHVRGRVVSDRGAGVASASVTARNTANGEYYSATADNSGRFDLPGKPGQWKVSVWASHTNLYDFGTNYTVIAGRDITNARIVLRTGTNIVSGYLRGSDGAPISNVSIEAVTSSQGKSTTTDANGRFALSLLNGEWSIGPDCWSLSGMSWSCVDSVSVTITNQNKSIDFTAAPSANILRGRLVNGEGEGIGMALLYLSGSNLDRGVETDAEGYFQVPINRGTWTVRFEGWRAAKLGLKQAEASFYLEEQQDKEVLLVALPGVAEIAGSVRDTSENPFIDFPVEIREVEDSPVYPSYPTVITVRTDTNGNFSAPVDGGNWTVQLSCASFEALQLACPNNEPLSQSIQVTNVQTRVDFSVPRIPVLRMTTTSLTNGMVKWPYYAELQATGGYYDEILGGPLYSWYTDYEELPPGLDFTDGRITGTPSVPGIFTFTVYLSDFYGITSLETNLTLIILSNSCRYTLSTNLVTFEAEGGTNTIQLTTSSPGCPWNISAQESDWLTVFPVGEGTGSMPITLLATPYYWFQTRMESVEVEGQVVTVVRNRKMCPEGLFGKKLILSSTNGSHVQKQVMTSTRHEDDEWGTISYSYDVLSLSGASIESGGFQFNARSDISLRDAEVILTRNTDNPWENPYVLDLTFESHSTGIVTRRLSLLDGEPAIGDGSFVMADDKADFNRDGRTDLVWQHNDGRVAAWCMNDKVLKKSVLLGPSNNVGSWRAVATADFNYDGHADILWQNGNGALAVRFMNGTSAVSTQVMELTVPPGQRLVAVADLTGDQAEDLVWQHSDGKVSAWNLYGFENYEPIGLRDTSPGVAWKAIGASDFNNDAEKDILFQHDDGRLAVWYFIGSDFLRSALISKRPSPGWRVVGLADLDLDGRDDFIWMNESRVMAVWYMKGTEFLGSALLRGGKPVEAGWRFVGPK